MDRHWDDRREERRQSEAANPRWSPSPRGRRRERSSSPRRRTKRSKRKGKRRIRGRRCWNCRKRDHVYGGCPQPIARKFCFRCGRQDRTVEECPRCGLAWRAQGPYVPGLGYVPREIRLSRGAAWIRAIPSDGSSDDAGVNRASSGSLM